MERAAFMLKVKKDRMEEYKQEHDAIWPELVEAIRRNGFHNYSIFLDDDGNLFGYTEVDESLDKSLKGMANEEANLRWQSHMADMFEDLQGRPDQSMVRLRHVFYLE